MRSDQSDVSPSDGSKRRNNISTTYPHNHHHRPSTDPAIGTFHIPPRSLLFFFPFPETTIIIIGTCTYNRTLPKRHTAGEPRTWDCQKNLQASKHDPTCVTACTAMMGGGQGKDGRQVTRLNVPEARKMGRESFSRTRSNVGFVCQQPYRKTPAVNL